MMILLRLRKQWSNFIFVLLNISYKKLCLIGIAHMNDKGMVIPLGSNSNTKGVILYTASLDEYTFTESKGEYLSGLCNPFLK